MDVGDLLGRGPGLGDGEGAGDAVGRLDVRDAEDVVRVRHRLVEEEVRAAVHEDGEHLELFRHRAEGRGVAARGDAREEIDLLGELHAAELFDVGVRAGVLVRLDRLDLALAEETALGVDLLRGEDVALVHGLAEDGRRARVEGHVADLVGRIRNLALGLGLGFGVPDQAGSSDERSGDGRGGRAGGHAELGQEVTTGDL